MAGPRRSRTGLPPLPSLWPRHQTTTAPPGDTPASSLDEAVSLAALVVFLLCLRGMVALCTRRTGCRVSGFRQGRTWRAVLVWAAFALGVLLAGFAADEHRGGATVVAGAVLRAGVAVVSRWWTRIYVAELRQGL